MSLSPTQFDGESLITPELLAQHGPLAIEMGRISDDPIADILATLSIFEVLFQNRSDTAHVLAEMVVYINRERKRLGHGTWKAISPILRQHSICAILHQDPFTDWSFRKPRGYSGDAHLLDYIYLHPNVQKSVSEASAIGQRLYAYSKDVSSSVAVRERRDLLAKLVDDTAAQVGPETEILTLAAGHLREAEKSEAFRDGGIKRWVALDQDPFSVAVINQQFGGTAVEPFDGSVKGYLTDAYELGQFDLVYAAGLYDYLPRAVAIKLTRKCLQSLKLGGTFLFANFAEDMIDDAFRETFMNWELLLRSEADMWDIVNMSVDRNKVQADVYTGENGVVIYGKIQLRV